MHIFEGKPARRCMPRERGNTVSWHARPRGEGSGGNRGSLNGKRSCSITLQPCPVARPSWEDPYAPDRQASWSRMHLHRTTHGTVLQGINSRRACKKVVDLQKTQGRTRARHRGGWLGVLGPATKSELGRRPAVRCRLPSDVHSTHVVHRVTSQREQVGQHYTNM
jgi:hypothetical protein